MKLNKCKSNFFNGSLIEIPLIQIVKYMLNIKYVELMGLTLSQLITNSQDYENKIKNDCISHRYVSCA